MVSKRCLENIRKVYGKYKEGVWKAQVILNLAPPLRVSGVCLNGVWKVSGRCLEGVWRVSERYPEGILNVS